MKVYIEKIEWYPVYCVIDGAKGEVVTSKEKMSRVRKAFGLFNEAQGILKSLYDKQEEKQ